jgi:ribosomal-protein-alanine N-acetyltransferase
MSLCIRKAEIQDLPIIYTFEYAYIKEIEPLAEQRWVNSIPALLHQWISNLPHSFIGNEGENQIGYFSWQIEGNKALLASIYILPAWRRKGYGLQLLNKFEVDAGEKGYKQLQLGVIKTNPAKVLYKAAGYQLIEINETYENYEKLVK